MCFLHHLKIHQAKGVDIFNYVPILQSKKLFEFLISQSLSVAISTQMYLNQAIPKIKSLMLKILYLKY